MSKRTPWRIGLLIVATLVAGLFSASAPASATQISSYCPIAGHYVCGYLIYDSKPVAGAGYSEYYRVDSSHAWQQSVPNHSYGIGGDGIWASHAYSGSGAPDGQYAIFFGGTDATPLASGQGWDGSPTVAAMGTQFLVRDGNVVQTSGQPFTEPQNVTLHHNATAFTVAVVDHSGHPVTGVDIQVAVREGYDLRGHYIAGADWNGNGDITAAENTDGRVLIPWLPYNIRFMEVYVSAYINGSWYRSQGSPVVSGGDQVVDIGALTLPQTSSQSSAKGLVGPGVEDDVALPSTVKAGTTVTARIPSTTASTRWWWFLDPDTDHQILLGDGTKNSVELTSDMAGHSLAVKVGYWSPGYVEYTTESTPVMIAAADPATSNPGSGDGPAATKATIRGSGLVDSTLHVEATGSAGAVFRYQWYRWGKAIPGATKTSYHTRTADIGSIVRAKVITTIKGVSATTWSGPKRVREHASLHVSGSREIALTAHPHVTIRLAGGVSRHRVTGTIRIYYAPGKHVTAHIGKRHVLSVTLPKLSAGHHTIKIAYSGNHSYTSSSATRSLTVSRR